MSAPSKSSWKAVNTPMNEPLNEDIINRMNAVVSSILSDNVDGLTDTEGANLQVVHLISKDKEFKYGPGKEVIAFCDGGKNKFGKDVKYVKWYYYFNNNKKFKISDRTYTYNTDKARAFWSHKIKEGFSKV